MPIGIASPIGRTEGGLAMWSVRVHGAGVSGRHEKAALCRAAENTCYFATVNCASLGSPTTSAIVRPDGTLLTHQPYGEEGLLIADIDITTATGLLAARCRTVAIL